MTAIMRRNLKIFFRDKSAVFFSLLAVLIIIGLYVLFLGDVWTQDMNGVSNARQLMDSWIIAGLLAVASVTTTMGAFGTMVNDKAQGIIKDLYVTPVKNGKLASGYIGGAFIIGFIMSMVTLIICQVYMIASGGDMMKPVQLIKIILLILLSSGANTVIMYFLVSFFKSQNAFATASTIIGTVIGFIMGIYLPIGVLPEGVQTVIKFFPLSYEVSLLRQVVMEDTMKDAFSGAPLSVVNDFKEQMGIDYYFDGRSVSWGMSILILVVTIVVFFLLSAAFMRGRKR